MTQESQPTTFTTFIGEASLPEGNVSGDMLQWDNTSGWSVGALLKQIRINTLGSLPSLPTGSTTIIYPYSGALWWADSSTRYNLSNPIIGSFGTGSVPTPNTNTTVGTNSIPFYSLSNNNAMYNTALGAYALNSLTDSTNSQHNTALGFGALQDMITGLRNVAIGSLSMNNITGTSAVDNVAIGYGAMSASSVTPSNNIAIGASALSAIQGIGNIGIGTSTASSALNASYNVIIGYQAGLSATAPFASVLIGYGAGGGISNQSTDVAIGSNALSGVAYGSVPGSGGTNIAIGNAPMFQATSGTSNCIALGNATLSQGGSNNIAIGQNAARSYSGNRVIAIGDNALYTGGGSQNTAIGDHTLYQCTTGSDNTTLGYQTLANLTGGTHNLSLGTQSGAGVVNSNGNIMIGRTNIGADNDNQLVIGGSNTGFSSDGTAGSTWIDPRYLTSSTDAGLSLLKYNTVSGKVTPAAVYGQTSTDGIAVYINAAGELGTISSSIRYKENISPLDPTSIYKLQPVSFNYRKDPTKPAYGLIAEEVENVMPTLVRYNSDGQVETVAYNDLIPFLLAALQEQKKILDTLIN